MIIRLFLQFNSLKFCPFPQFYDQWKKITSLGTVQYFIYILKCFVHYGLNIIQPTTTKLAILGHLHLKDSFFL